VTRLNAIRRAHPAFTELRTIRFHDSGQDMFVAFSKTTPDGRDPVLVIVNLDPHDWQETTLSLDLGALGLPSDSDYEAHDELGGQTFTWNGPNPYVRLDPSVAVAHVLSLRTRW
jgi:starch synthase (maltosyl-transferring)